MLKNNPEGEDKLNFSNFLRGSMGHNINRSLILIVSHNTTTTEAIEVLLVIGKKLGSDQKGYIQKKD